MNRFSLIQQLAIVGGIGVLTAGNYAANHLVGRLPRIVYTIFVVFLAGTIIPAGAIRVLVGGNPAFLAFAPVPLAAAGLLGGAFLFMALRREGAAQWRRLPKLLVALFAPSLAESLVFLGIVFGVAQAVLEPHIGMNSAIICAVLATSGSFALYHLTHAAPWNAWPVVKILLMVWLGIGAFYAVTQNLWAAALVNTLMATVGFVKNRVTRPEEQSVAISALLNVLAIVSVLWICGSWLPS